jgi:hypothetical protein
LQPGLTWLHNIMYSFHILRYFATKLHSLLNLRHNVEICICNEYDEFSEYSNTHDHD